MLECRDQAHYDELCAKISLFNAELEIRFGSGPVALTPAMLAVLPPNPTNDERSAVETWDFAHTVPEKAFAYVGLVDDRPATITTWTGQKLGDVISYGHEYTTPAFGTRSTRQSLTVRGINGFEYVGTYYVSSGNYCRLRLRASELRRKAS